MATCRELALTNLGFIIEGRRSHAEYEEADFPSPYDKAITLLKAHPESLIDKSEADALLSTVLMPDEIQEAHYQSSKYNGLGEPGVFDFRKALRSSTEKLRLAKEAHVLAKKCENNEDVDYMKFYSRIGSLISSGTTGPRPANQIDYKSYKPYMKSGIDWMDNIIGGWPTDGPVVVLAPQGTGKSHFQFYTTCMWLLTHPDKHAVIYTLEMSDKHYLARELSMYPEFIPLVECENPRLHISATVRGVDEIAAEVSTGKYGWVGIDAMTQLAKGGDASTYEKIYQVLVEICRFQEIPVQILAQPNREAKKSNKFIGIYDAAWSSAAENAAAMFLSLNRLSYADPEWNDTRFVPIETENPQHTDRFYICFWKFRDNRPAELQQGLGAIRLEPDPTTGYYKQIWKGEALKNKLWPISYQKPVSIGSQQASTTKQEDKPVLRITKR